MIRVALSGAAERAERWADIAARLQQRLSDLSRNSLTLSSPRRVAGLRGQLRRAKRRAVLSAEEIAALDAAVMDELER